MIENSSADANLCLYNATNTANNWSKETGNTGIHSGVAYWINVVIVCEMPVSICCNAVALRIMFQCRKLPKSIRHLSINFLIAFLALGISNLSLSVTRLALGPNNCYYELIFDFRTYVSIVFLLVLWCTICALTVERFITVRFPFQYATIVTQKTLKLAIGCLWSFNTIVPSVILCFSWYSVCGQYSYKYIFTCDIFEIFKPVKLFKTFVLCLLYIITIVVYFKILVCIRRHQRAIKSLNQGNGLQSKSGSHPFSNMILPIVLSFVLLQSPHVFTTIILDLRPDTQQRNFRILFHVVYYICLVLNNYLTLYLYVWRFPECRMIFYHMLSKINSRYNEKADILRMEVFVIVTSSRNVNGGSIDKKSENSNLPALQSDVVATNIVK